MNIGIASETLSESSLFNLFGPHFVIIIITLILCHCESLASNKSEVTMSFWIRG